MVVNTQKSSSKLDKIVISFAVTTSLKTSNLIKKKLKEYKKHVLPQYNCFSVTPILEQNLKGTNQNLEAQGKGFPHLSFAGCDKRSLVLKFT